MSNIGVHIPSLAQNGPGLILNVAGATDEARARRVILEDLTSEGYTFEGLDLSGFDFKNVIAPGLTVKDCVISGASFEGANISGASFENVRFFKVFMDQSTKADDSRWTGINFSESVLNGLRVPRSQWQGGAFRFSQVRSLVADDSVWRSIRTAGSDLSGWRFDTLADLRGLEGAESVIASSQATDNVKAALLTTTKWSIEAARDHLAKLDAQEQSITN